MYIIITDFGSITKVLGLTNEHKKDYAIGKITTIISVLPGEEPKLWDGDKFVALEEGD